MLLLAVLLASASPLTVNQQGRLLDVLGQPVQGEQTLSFRLVNADDNSVFSETLVTPVDNGYYSVILGAQPSNLLDSDLFLVGSTLTIEVDLGAQTFEGGQLVPVPLAGHALTAEQIATRPLNDASGALASCEAIRDDGSSRGTGAYYIDSGSGPERVHCQMDLASGGWTHLATINPSDGSSVRFSNTRFWEGTDTYGWFGGHLTHDYRSAVADNLAGTEMLIVLVRHNSTDAIIGWRHWQLTGSQTWNAMFTSANNTALTSAVVATDMGDIHTHEPLIGASTDANVGAQLRTNALFGSSNDRARLNITAYSPLGNDNQPGLGTMMNQASGLDVYLWADAELWVDSGTNLWRVSPSSESLYARLGFDNGCGQSCVGTNNMMMHPNWYETWDYQIYVR
ncbi:MAG: hypothetical protein ACI855_003112 [Myxococcota bacterium]|jgi:hypothetical protein